MTNFEKIKQMSVEDMAKFFIDDSSNIDFCKMCENKCEYDIAKFTGCEHAIQKWLESEAEE